MKRRETERQGEHQRRRWPRVFVTILGSFIVVSCDLAMYDADATGGARQADEFEFVAREEYGDWDFYSDDDELIQPQGFYPDAVDATTGYVLYRANQKNRVWRLDSNRIIGEVEIGYGSSTVHTDSDAWIVPIGPTVENLLEYRPILLAASWDDSRSVELRAIRYDPDAGVLTETPIDLVAQAQTVEPTATEAISVNVVSYGPASVRGEGAPFSTVAGSELQLLVRLSSGSAKELIFRGTGVDFVDWALGNTSAIVSAQGTVSNQFPLPTRTDGDLPVGVRHATDFSQYTGILMFHDGDYSTAPIRVFTWASDAVTQVPAESSWAGRVSSITYNGVLRTGRSGTYSRVTAFDATPVIGSEENASMWYAGQYRRSGATDAPMVDIYTQTGVVKSIGSRGVLTVAIYRD